MELVTEEADRLGRTLDDHLHAGTAADHYSLGSAHLGRAISLTCCPGQQRKSGVAPATLSPVKSLDEDITQQRAACIFYPTDGWKEAWDMFILFAILYSAVLVPYRICFNQHPEGINALLDLWVTTSFIMDVCFNFNTAYLDEERWVTGRGQIACRYLSGWFWIDAPSSVPIELLSSLIDANSKDLQALRFLRLFRLLRLLRLLKVLCRAPLHAVALGQRLMYPACTCTPHGWHTAHADGWPTLGRRSQACVPACGAWSSRSPGHTLGSAFGRWVSTLPTSRCASTST